MLFSVQTSGFSHSLQGNGGLEKMYSNSKEPQGPHMVFSRKLKTLRKSQALFCTVQITQPSQT